MRGSTESRRTFSLPAELERSAPRDVTLTTGGRALLLLAWMLASAAVGGGIGLHREAQRQGAAALDFDRRAVPASAVVDRLWRKNSGEDKPPYAAFHFDANGVRIDGESRMEHSTWRQLRTGSVLAVRYLPDNPRNFTVAGRRKGRMPSALAYIFATVFAALALLCLAAVRWQRYLLSEGRPAQAHVTALRKHKGSHGTTHQEIVYEFPVFAGTIATGKASVSKSAEVGSTITVVYDREQPQRNRPYPFSLVTLSREW